MAGLLNARITCAAVAVGLGLVVASLPAISAPSTLLDPQTTVILFSGIPGDVESETTYRDQMASWLGNLQAQGATQAVHVLCDSGERLVASSPTVFAHKGDRDAFLKLASDVAITNPVLLVAWGHGGNQGSTPVFHVRGPRIAPNDFAEFARRMGTNRSNWVLLFRGSGAFARALAGPGRQILSSECDTPFTSDPIGMTLLLKLVRDEPSLPFETLAQKFGASVQRWYADRNLARTEEPTFWRETQKPVLLAAADDSRLLTSSPTVPGKESEPSSNRTEQAEAPEPTPHVVAYSPEPLAPAWKEIKRVEPRDFPDDDAVLLRRHVRYVLGDNPAVNSEEEQFIQVLTPEGKHLGDFSLQYSPPMEDVSFEDCEVLLPDGKLVRLDPDAIHEAADQTASEERLSRRKMFSLPGVVPGAILHVRLRTEWKKFPLPHFSMTIPVQQTIPVLESEVRVSVPRDRAFHFALKGVAGPDPVISQSSYGTTYTWSLGRLAPHKSEPLAPSESQGKLLVSTFPGWGTFSAWYERIIRLTAEATPEIAAKARDLTRDAKTDHEKVAALYHFVTGLRYVALPLGISSVRPHSAASVLQNQFGDCKDKANLLNTLLRAVDIKADLVLVPRFGQADQALPGMFFNHAISRVLLDGQPLWIDTTDDICRFGMLPPGDPGRSVLVIDGTTTNLVLLPGSVAAQHSLSISTKLAWEADGNFAATLEAHAKGYPDYRLRMDTRAQREHGGSLPVLAASMRPSAGSFVLEKQTASPVSALDQDFSWSATGSFVGLSSADGTKRLLRPSFWLPKEWEAALHRRESPLVLNLGYPLRLEQEIEIKLPGDPASVTPPARREEANPPLRWQIEWRPPREGNQWAAHFRAELATGDLSSSETVAFQKQLRALLAALAEGFTFPGSQ